MPQVRPIPVDSRSGHKVGWEVYHTLEEAKRASVFAIGDASYKEAEGYDFGYQCPGEITEIKPYHSARAYVDWYTNLDEEKTYYEVVVP